MPEESPQILQTSAPNAQIAPRPPVRRIAPRYRALGYSCTPGQSYYWLEVNGQVRRFKPTQMHGLAFLIGELYPDPGYWRAGFPKANRSGIDTHRATATIVRLCREAGEYRPEPAP